MTKDNKYIEFALINIIISFFTIILLITVMYLIRVDMEENHKVITQKIDEVILIQQKIIKLDSCYLRATRIHMGQCAFILKEGIEADSDN